MVDIDHFKQYNDYYGHPAGDACLVSVASILQQAVGREGDMVARLGGEEFALLLPDTNEVGARVVADKLRDKLTKADLAHARSDTSSRVTLSVGVATCIPGRGMDILMLMETADKALYLAKQGGRNQTFVAPESGEAAR
jgi:diguanylate cyclase (GGDEF)-like protein